MATMSHFEREEKLESLTADLGGRFKLCTLMQKRLREVLRQAMADGIPMKEKPFYQVIDEVFHGDIELLTAEEGKAYLEEMAQKRQQEES